MPYPDTHEKVLKPTVEDDKMLSTVKEIETKLIAKLPNPTFRYAIRSNF